MVYLILAGLVLAAITINALRRARPMPPDMEDEECRVQFNEWIIRPRAAGDRFQDMGGEA